MQNVNKVKLLSERTSGAPPVIFVVAKLCTKKFGSRKYVTCLQTQLSKAYHYSQPKTNTCTNQKISDRFLTGFNSLDNIS